MASKKNPTPSANNNISISGDVKDSAVIIGDNNTVNQNFFQKIVNYIFPGEKETLEHRNRRILLGHVENAWIKGVLDASLHGAALLDLGIKQDPEAVTKYPWAIKKESTEEALPVGTSMLEIFDSIGMGRSLLILGAPGSGKTTMLLELARQLIARARADVTQPIPMVFNLASWTEKLSLANWLAQELNNLYSIPRKTAPDWVMGNKLLFLLDGLDEVQQESRAKCVEAINAFRKEHGLTSLAVCSRSQDYADLNAKLSFEGAIEVQPLTQKQITEFFNRFGKEMAGIKQVLKKDTALREMAETPLFLSIMIMAYRDKQDIDILVSQDENAQRKHLFDTYIERMFERHLKNVAFKKQYVARWLSWLAGKMMKHNQVPYLLENMQADWLNQKRKKSHLLLNWLFNGTFYALLYTFIYLLIFEISISKTFGLQSGMTYGISFGIVFGIFYGLIFALSSYISEIEMPDNITWDWSAAKSGLVSSILLWLVASFVSRGGVINSFFFGVIFLFLGFLVGFKKAKPITQIKFPGQRINQAIRNNILVFLLFVIFGGISYGFLSWLVVSRGAASMFRLDESLVIGFSGGLSTRVSFGLSFFTVSLWEFALDYLGGDAVIKHYILRFGLYYYDILPWRLIPFLDHCVDLIFLRRVGGGYIFVHRLLMEHFAEMYVEDNA